MIVERYYTIWFKLIFLVLLLKWKLCSSSTLLHHCYSLETMKLVDKAPNDSNGDHYCHHGEEAKNYTQCNHTLLSLVVRFTLFALVSQLTIARIGRATRTMT